MWLITGGIYQNKLEYTLEMTGCCIDDVADGEICDFNDINKYKIIDNFNLLVKRALKERIDIYDLVESMETNNPDVIIIVDELGCGVVPINPFEREYRETTGRVSCKLAKKATQVHRIVCGIGGIIKNV